MYIYTRNTERKLLSLRILFILFLASWAAFFLTKNYSPVYLISALLVFGGFIVVSDFKRTITSVEIDKYFFYGLVRRTWIFNNGDKIIIKSDGTSFDDEANIAEMDTSDTGAGCLLALIYPVFGKPRIGKIKFWLQKTGDQDRVTGEVAIFLTRNEYDMVKKVASVRTKQ